MTSLIIKLFIKDNKNISDPRVRTSYGKVSSVVGIFCNILLFVFKLLAGMITHSIAIIGDAINNISDASGNIISLVGFKLASRAPDEKHPYGYARYEYFTGLVVSIMITAIGFSLGKESLDKLINPVRVGFNYLSLIILIVSVIIKLWMYLFNRKMGEIIDSDALSASAMDSRNDAIATSAVIISSIVCKLTGIVYFDGITGIFVSIFIIYSGVMLVRETLSPLLGEAPDKDLVSNIEKKVMSYPGVLGMHDLMVHDYGPGHKFAGLHIELPAENSSLDNHDLIERIEEDILAEYGVMVSIHMDPIVTNDPRVEVIRKYLVTEIEKLNVGLSLHDLRLVSANGETKVLFDLVFPAGFKGNWDKIVDSVGRSVIAMEGNYTPKIKAEQSFV